MAESAYHWDALRKERIIQRKREAQRRLQASTRLEENQEYSGYKGPEDNLITADQGEFAMLRSNHKWTGREREQRFYDHSRTGPILGRSWLSLKREMRFRESCLSHTIQVGSRQPADLGYPYAHVPK